ncbi:MAG: ABC transporter ATP-binding protein [Oxalicibacterium faecigallinarum]|uniref:ABC transporter ATP-binding protein n=1 Tax=Oxalicibacterium faecigallinarum TaxID=573741 RepID=UPI0028095576|nr:ABC transporter ATP-binding protein [Oxalicibacterium faecigallinarum]MDQ7968829.1 ABC transporter ATP-binding protein [Oxalicibacterium faecigallinarum]
MSDLLRITDLFAGYDNSSVLQGINLSVRSGEIVALLGRNGAGRSTLVKSIMGLIKARGSIRFHDQEILGWPTYRIARAGIAYVAESRDVFPTLTVAQNLQLGEKRRGASRWSMTDMIRLFPHLEKRLQVPAGVLSGGEQQMLALARAMLIDPALLIVDEPTEGLAPQLVELIAAFLREVRDQGTAILLIEQKQSIALSIAQRVYLMGHGQIVHEGTPENLIEHDALCREWLTI